MSDGRRPDPDELLSRIAAEETEARAESSTRGKLKIFFGACAGVGKTYAMLSAGKQALAEGIDVVVGLVETHGREETKKLLDGIPILPHREVQYRGTVIKEFDLDAALARKPQLILLDEFAHTNAPGSRHPKRWNDVEELLAAGIHVYTTINVQHLESLNDVVARITGVWVKETVPDAIFDGADEISLIDLPSEELLKRLKTGKVYIAPEAKKRAAQNFFKKSNLIALRELALRRTAERVDAMMDAYKTGNGGTQSWSGSDRILVCVGPDSLSPKLVRAAKRMAGGLKAPWTAVYVENERHYRLNKEAQDAVDRTLRLAERMGGETETIQGQKKAAAEILQYARANAMTKIIVGKTPKPRWREIVEGTLADEVIRASGDIDVYVVTGGEAEERKSLNAPLWRWQASWQAYLTAGLIVAALTLMMLLLRPLIETPSFVMAYLVGVVGIALRYGRGPALLATVISALGFNFFLTPPYYAFKITEEQHVVTFIVLLLAGVIIGTQTARLRLQAVHARKREKQTEGLFAMSRELSANRGKLRLAEIAATHVVEALESDVFVWLPDENGQLRPVVAETEIEGGAIDPVRDESVARWAFTHKQNAGLGTDTLPSARALYAPLSGSRGVIGVIGIAPHEEGESYSSDQMALLETFAGIIASALERADAAELVERTLVEAESEKLRNILLSSVSHDLRTPLATITSAVSTLLIDNKLGEFRRKEVLKAIHEESARLARMVTNLLDVSSLESGSVKLNKELYFIEELIGSALMRVEGKLADHRVLTNIEHALPLIQMDGLLIEQVLINLLENAADYTPPGTTVSITAVAIRPDVHVIVSDNGPGVPKGDEERIFDKFYAGAGRSGAGGGIGLAICRGIIHAHGGKIWAKNNPEGGATFTFTLPIKSGESE